MFPVFTISVVILIIIFTIGRVKNTHAQEKKQEQFFQRELEANNTRKKDISQLAYINIPLEKFPLNLHSENEQHLKELSGQKILNLTGLSNTDLKLQYGVANLNLLTEYDNNFTDLVRTLSSYADELLAAGNTEDAQQILEYAVSIQADSGSIFVSLAKLYQGKGEYDKINQLIDSAQQLHSLSKDSLSQKLQDYLPNAE